MTKTCRKGIHNYSSELKRCPQCEKVKNTEYKLKNKAQIAIKKKIYNENNKEKIAKIQKEYIDNNRSKIRAKNAKRRASKLSATPSWADQVAIQEIYAQCPEGYHVDHIEPLQGKNICGLHIASNLQYLTPEENLSKGNR